MTEALRERDLRPSDCAGGLECSRAAGVSKILESGKYEGLPQSCSARDVCAAVLGEVEVLAGPVKGDRPEDDVLVLLVLSLLLLREGRRGDAQRRVTL